MPPIISPGGSGVGPGGTSGAKGSTRLTNPYFATYGAAGLRVPTPGGSLIAPAPSGGSGGGSSGGGGGGGGSGGGGNLLPAWPTLKPPAWYTGPPKNLNDVASMIRNAFFACLGDLSGYPYSTQQIYQAYLYPMLVSQNQTEPLVLPATLTITVYDAAGNQISQDTVIMNQASNTVAVPGTYSLTASYFIEVIAAVSGAATLTTHYGPFTGQQMASVGNPAALIVPYNPAGTSSGTFTFQNADGSPAVNYPVAIALSQPQTATQEPASVGAPSNSLTNAKGQVVWAAELQELSANGTYVISVLVYTGTLNADGTITGALLGTWTSPNLSYDQIQGYSATIPLTSLVAPSSSSGGTPGGTGPPHHGRTT